MKTYCKLCNELIRDKEPLIINVWERLPKRWDDKTSGNNYVGKKIELCSPICIIAYAMKGKLENEKI